MTPASLPLLPESGRPGRRLAPRLASLLIAGVLVAACSSSANPVSEPRLRSCTDASGAEVNPPASFAVLVFTRTAGYVHASIPNGVAAIRALGRVTGFSVDATSDAGRFTDAGLAPYQAVVFLSTTGDVLNDAQQAAFERWLAAGHGWVGIHSATDTEYDWPWYQSMLGAHFADHPAIQKATVRVVDAAHLSTERLPGTIARTDEWYNFNQQPAGAHVLVDLDEGSYSGGTMGATHPLSWMKDFDGGRVWYTAMGHTSESYAEIPFLEHLRGGILWAARMDSLRTCPL